MDWSWLGKIPWADIIKTGRNIYNILKESPENGKETLQADKDASLSVEEQVAELRSALDEVQQNQSRQDKLSGEMANQLQEVVKAARVLSVRLNWAFGVGVVAMVVGLFAILIRFWQ